MTCHMLFTANIGLVSLVETCRTRHFITSSIICSKEYFKMNFNILSFLSNHECFLWPSFVVIEIKFNKHKILLVFNYVSSSPKGTYISGVMASVLTSKCCRSWVQSPFGRLGQTKNYQIGIIILMGLESG